MDIGRILPTEAAAILNVSQPKTDLPTHVTVRSTGRPSTVLCEQVYSVSTERIGTYIGECTDKEMENIDIALMISLQLDGSMKTSKKYNETIKNQQEETYPQS